MEEVFMIEETDRHILEILQADASIPLATLAERVGLSLSPCWRRVKRLREEGVIVGQVTLLDPKAVGLTVTVMATVTLESHAEENVTAFEDAVRTAPEVMECYAVTGERDYLLRIVVTDIEAYEQFLTARLLHLPMVRSVNSRFALRKVKYSTVLPLELASTVSD